MALANTTTASDLIIPQVWGDFLAAKLPYSIKFRPLVEVDTTLQGQPGDAITYAQWGYIGDAVDLAELADVPLTKMGATTGTSTIKKAAKGLGFSDEAILKASGGPEAEGNRQIVQAFAQKVDKDIHAEALAEAGKTATADGGAGAAVPFTIDNFLTNLVQFPEYEIEQFSALVVSTKDYVQQVVKSAYFTNAAASGEASTIVTGGRGELAGIPLVVSERAVSGALLVEKGSLGLNLKRDVMVERDRDIVNFSTIVTASMHYAATVPRPSGVLKFAASA